MPNSPIVQRVVDLMRLATNSGAAENEARNAASEAVRLIIKHGLRVVDTPDSTATATRTTTQTTTRTTTATWQTREAKWDAWERAAREREDVDRRHAEYERRQEQPLYPWVAREPSKCGSCGTKIAVGSDCFYGPYPRHGWRCGPCVVRGASPRRPRKRKKPSATA